MSDSGPSGTLGASVGLARTGEDVPARESVVMVDVGGTVGCESGVVKSAEVVQPAVTRTRELKMKIARFIRLFASNVDQPTGVV